MSKIDRRVAALSKEIGRRVRAARERTDISQESLAKLIGMSRTNYARIEHGRTNVTIDSLVRIAEGLGLEVSVSLTKPTSASRASERTKRSEPREDPASGRTASARGRRPKP